MKIYLVARPAIDFSEILAFLGHESTHWNRSSSAMPAEELVEYAGRVCYMSFGRNQSGKSNAEYIANLIRSGHESVLEHVSWSFMISGISRSFTHQLVRHRVGFAFSQLSQQYHDESAAGFVKPGVLAHFPEASDAWANATGVALESYRTILAALESGKMEGLSKNELRRSVRSAARSVLPNATETKIVVTANARALRHLFAVRGGIPGDVEMRQVTSELLRLMKQEAPSLFFDFATKTLPDGTPMIEKTG